MVDSDFQVAQSAGGNYFLRNNNNTFSELEPEVNVVKPRQPPVA